MVNFEKVRAHGHWVFLRLETPILYDGWQKSKGGLYIPGKSEQDKLGHCWAQVLSVGSGKWDSKSEKRIRADVTEGDTVYIRWYLSEINRPSEFDDEHCFIHQDDLIIAMERGSDKLVVG